MYLGLLYQLDKYPELLAKSAPSMGQSFAWVLVFGVLSAPILAFTAFVPTDDLNEFTKMLATTFTLYFGGMFVLMAFSEKVSVSLGLVTGSDSSKKSLVASSSNITLIILDP